MAYNIEKYDAFVVDPDLGSRAKLKSAAMAVNEFGRISLVNSLREATAKLEAGDRGDVCFIAYTFSQAEVTKFITDAKNAHIGLDTAFVVLLKGKDQNNETVATNVLLGADGFLFEPYSVESLVGITKLACKVKGERAAARERVALTLVIQDIIKQLDLVVEMKSSGASPSTSMKKLEEMTASIRKLTNEKRDIYYEIMEKLLSEIPPPRKPVKAKYAGASERLRKKFETTSSPSNPSPIGGSLDSEEKN